MRILLVGDVHNTCGYDTEINSYIRWANETHGYKNKDRMDLFVDGILREHKKAPIDALLVLGDLANTDKPFQYYYRKYKNEILGTERDAWNGEVLRYLKDVFYQSDYDAIYDFKTNYLDRILAAGIPYYVVRGNHDAYTDEMWCDLFSGKKDAEGNTSGETHIGENGETSFLVRFPEYDTAFLLFDTYAFDEKNGDLGPFYHYFMEHDNVAYTPIMSNETRKAQFLHLVEEAKDFRHLYVAAHYFAGKNVITGEWENDTPYLLKEANRYGNLSGIFFGHDQYRFDRYLETGDGRKIFHSCVNHFVGTFMNGKVIENGKEETVHCSIAECPFGYSDLRHKDGVAHLDRIFPEAFYEPHDDLAAFFKRCHPEWTGKYFITPFEKSYHQPYAEVAVCKIPLK